MRDPLSRAAARRLGRRARRTRWLYFRLALPATNRLCAAAMQGNPHALRELTKPKLRHHLHNAWHEWLRSSPDRADLVAHLDCQWYQRQHAEEALTMIMLEPDPAMLTAQMRPGIAVAAALDDHPIAKIARRKIRHAGDQDLIDEVCRVAAGHPGLAEFCRQNDLVPADPLPRATHLLLTGQHDHYRSADPDGALALMAYHEADDAERLLLRTAAADHSTLARRLTEGHHQDRIDQVRGAELARLTTAIANREEWSALWDVVVDAAPVDAVRLVHLLPADWRPENDPDRRLHTALRSVPADRIAAAIERPSLVATIDPRMKMVTSVAVGESTLAVTGRRAFGDQLMTLALYALPTGARLARCAEDKISSIVAVHDDIVMTEDSSHQISIHSFSEPPVTVPEGPLRRFTPFTDGWAAVSGKELVIGTSQGDVLRRIPLGQINAIAATPDGDRIAAAGNGKIVIVDSTGRHATTTTLDDEAVVNDMLFLSDGRLLTVLRRRSGHKYTEHRIPVTGPNYEFDITEIENRWDLLYWSVAADNTLTADKCERDVWRSSDRNHGPHRTTYRSPPSWDRRAKRSYQPAVVDNTSDHPSVGLYELPSTPRRVLLSGPWKYPHGEHGFLSQDGELVRAAYDDPVLGRRERVTLSSQRRGRHLAFRPVFDGPIEVHDLVLGDVLTLLNRPCLAMTPADHVAVATLAEYPDDHAAQLLRAFLEFRAACVNQAGRTGRGRRGGPHGSC